MTNQAALIAKTILSHLKSSGQTALISEVVDALRSSSEYKTSQNRVVLTSALPMAAKEVTEVHSYLTSMIQGSYELEQAIDPSVIAGFTLQINDMLIDASVLGKINTIQHKLTEKQ